MARIYIITLFLLTITNSLAFMQPEATKGHYLAFVAPSESATDIFVADLATGRVRNVTNNQVQSANPTWSGDGTQLAFNNVLNGNNPEIFVMEANGLKQRNVTNNPAADVAPDWSPVSNEIAFMSNRENGKYDLYVFNLDTKETRRLTTDGIDKNRPRWSPDGKKIAYWQIEGQNVPLKILNVASGEVKTLFGKGQNLWVSWSPDGKKIATYSEESGVAQIYVIDLAKSTRTQITSGEAANIRPDWSPDGTQISFASNRNGSYDLFLMNVDGSNVRSLVEGTGDDISPVWRAANSEIDFAANPLIPQSAVQVSQESISGSDQTQLGVGVYRLFAPQEAALKDVIRVRLEIEVGEGKEFADVGVPLRETDKLTVYRYMGAQLTGIDLDHFEIFPNPSGYLLQMQEEDANYWEWYLRPKDAEALGQRFFVVEIYLPDIGDDGVVTKDVQKTIFFDLNVVSEKSRVSSAVQPTEAPSEDIVQIIQDPSFVQGTVQPEPVEGISVYLNTQNLLAISFEKDVDVGDMRIASGAADYPIVQLFPDLKSAFENVAPANFCVFLERDRSQDVPPLSCQTNNSLQRSLNAGDVFWYSSLSENLQDVVIRHLGKTFVCSPRFERCDF